MYELMIISGSDGGDTVISKVEKLLRDASVGDLRVSKLGKKVLAYPIKKQTEGEYVVFNFESDGIVLKDLDELLRPEQETILRYMVLKTKVIKKSKAAKAIKVSEAIQEQKELKPTAKVTVRTKTEVTSKVTKVAKVSQVSNVAKVAKSAGVTKEKKSVKKKGNE